MRAIKFRAKDKKGEWLYGSLSQWRHCERAKIATSEEMPYQREALIYVEVDPNTVGQFTGFKDSKGNDIYEGDIIQFHDREDDIAEVLWRDDLGCFTLKIVGEDSPSDLPLGHWLNNTSYKYKVIGNVYDNSELLNDAN